MYIYIYIYIFVFVAGCLALVRPRETTHAAKPVKPKPC